MSDLLDDLKPGAFPSLVMLAVSDHGHLEAIDLGFPSAPALSGVKARFPERQGAAAAPTGNVDGRTFARELGIGLKSGANIRSIDGGLVPAMAAVATEAERLGLAQTYHYLWK